MIQAQNKKSQCISIKKIKKDNRIFIITNLLRQPLIATLTDVKSQQTDFRVWSEQNGSHTSHHMTFRGGVVFIVEFALGAAN